MVKPLLLSLSFLFLLCLNLLLASELYHTVKQGETLSIIANKYGVSVEEIKKWNNLQNDRIKAGQKIVIKKLPRESTKRESVKREEQTQERVIYHTVKKGETLSAIAQKYGVSEQDLIAWNNIKKGQNLTGKRLLIKLPSQKISSSQETHSTSQFEEALIHIVKRGETLQKIAQRYGVSEKEILQWNALKSSNVKEGQRLIIKKPLEESKVKLSAKERKKEILYKVAPGDTLPQIAKLFGVKEEDIIKANKLENKNLKPGQRLVIPILQEEEKSTKEKVATKPKGDTIEGIFEELQRKEEELKKGRQDRRTYLELISEYRHLYLVYPKSQVAPLALFKTGELFLELYEKSLRKEDAKEAAKRFELFLKNYPDHEKAEKAYRILLDIYEKELKQEDLAKRLKEEWGKKFPEIKTSKTSSPKEPTKSLKEPPKPKAGNETERSGPLYLIADLKKVLKIEPITGEDYTRVIVDISGNFEYQANLLTPQGEMPPRLYVDIYPAQLGENLQRSFDIQDRHLQRIRVGQFDRQTVRVVLDMKSLSDYKLFKVKDPPQLIIDLIGKEKKKTEKIAKIKPYTPEKETKVKRSKEKEENLKSPLENGTAYINLARQFGLGVRRIMLDPGHGGEDPGALGPNGLKEKEVVLKLAKLVGSKLMERFPGIEILYTRTTDAFIPLAKRPALANSMKADLFISLHLNASPDPKAKGIETYYLNFTTDPEAMRVAALENRVNEKGLADLQDLVKAILANTKLNESKLLAEKVQKELVRHLSYFHPDIEDRGVKYAPFLVLVGTRMPAILIEADFITNPTSAERLTKEDYLEKIAEGITKGIENYIQSLKFSEVPSFEKGKHKTGS